MKTLTHTILAILVAISLISCSQETPMAPETVKPVVVLEPKAPWEPFSVVYSSIPDGATNIPVNTNKIIVTVNKPIKHENAQIFEPKTGDRLEWEWLTTNNTITFSLLTPEDVKRILKETSVTEYRWVGTPLDTPAHQVKGKFVPVQVNTISGLNPSTPLKPNTEYIISMSLYDKSEIHELLMIKFKTAP